MCTNRRTIINSLGKSLVVNCGKCPACLQEKAVARTNRIRNNHAPGVTSLFVTLTYRNCCCPYFDKDELDIAPISTTIMYDSFGQPYQESYKTVNVYRDVSVRRVRRSSNYDQGFKDFRNREILTHAVLPFPACDETHFQFLQNSHSHHVGVSYLPDIQNYFKNLNQYVKRHFPDGINFSYYYCSEYGPTTCRPHFHFLLFVSDGDLSMWKKAISEAWPYDNHRLTRSNVEIAVNASSYVSSYVNCSSSVPKVLADHSEFKPKHNYSQGFGLALQHLSLVEVFKAYQRGDLKCNVSRIRNGSLVVDSVLLPKYVLSRYFPKIKGYCRLSVNELRELCYYPEKLSAYCSRLSYSLEDLHTNKVRLLNAKLRFLSFGLSEFDFADAYSGIWSLRYSLVLRDFYEDKSNIANYFTAYDNIIDYYRGSVISPTLDDLMFFLPPDFHYEVDYNKFPDIVYHTAVMHSAFDSYSKDRKIRNRFYSTHTNLKNRV